MGRISATAALIALAPLAAAAQATPEQMLGVFSGQYELFGAPQVRKFLGNPALLSDANPEPVGHQPAPGTGGFASRVDHVHFGPVPLFGQGDKEKCLRVDGAGSALVFTACPNTPDELPDLPGGAARYYLEAKGVATDWVRGDVVPHYTSGNANQCVKVNALGTGLSFGTCGSGGGGVTLSDKTPVVTGESGNAGTGTQASRDDHQHVAPQLAVAGEEPADVGTVAAVGTGEHSARDDHVHKGPVPSFTGHGGNCLKVNSGGTGLEFDACPGGGSSGGDANTSWVEVFSYTVGSQQAAGPVIIGTNNNATVKKCHDWITSGVIGVRQTFGIHWFGLSPVSGSGTLYAAGWIGESSGAWYMRVEIGPTTDGALKSDTACQLAFYDLNTAGGHTWKGDALSFVKLDIAGGGGGGSSPSIPAPTAAGKLKHLRVNAAGAAYELADPPAPGSVIKGIKTGSNVAGTEATFARTDHEHAIPGTLYGTPVATGSANAAGTATTVARSDHVHKSAGGSTIPTIPADHADHDYLLSPNAAGDAVEWTHNVDDALQENAGDIGAADRRIDDLVKPSFGLPYPEDGYVFNVQSCLFNVDLQKEVCATKWSRPAMWEYVKLYDHTVNNWTSHDGSFTIPAASHDIHAALESSVTAYRRFIINAGWSRTSSGQTTAYWQAFELAGIPVGNVLGTSENAVFYSLNSNNAVSGSFGYGRLEVSHDGDHTVHLGLNTGGSHGVRFVVYGVR